MNTSAYDIRDQLEPNDLRENLDNVKEKLREAKDSMAKTVHDSKENMEKLIGRSVRKFRVKSAGLQRNVSTYIKDNPVKTMGLALLVGALLAKIVRL